MPIQVNHDERRKLVGEVVARIIASKGLEAVTVREVAKASGFSTRVVSHYFSGKREVLLLCYRQTAIRAQQRLNSAVAAAPGDVAAGIDALLPYHAQAREDWLVWVSFWGMAIGDPEFSAVQRLQVRASQEYLQALLTTAMLPLPTHGFDPVYAARNLMASLSGMVVQAAFDPEQWPSERQQAYLRSAIKSAIESAEKP
ncbi:TetR/AcrR family transcriptional regulator [Pseudomonas umsongensis]|uniref:TetR/AcrR family transcriptional regulator n=1 Tax=Pseudomonas umsongensis TaxID=198618 RepID=UPI00200A41B6|nr:TetR/AcrR family transcriptional regulator [Pseudomonas umsongensis]MCK8683289.1 TetR family transcriptional regulator [Pseudomonas umsongensis]